MGPSPATGPHQYTSCDPVLWPERVVLDAARLAALRASGFVVVEVTEEEVWHRPHEVVQRVGAARYERSGRGIQRPGRRPRGQNVRRRDVA